MKRYIIVSCEDDNITKPDIFSDESAAYKFYANTLFDEAKCYLNVEEYEKYKDSFNGSTEEIDENIKNMMNTIMERHNDVWKNQTGYVFRHTEYNYTLAIFEIEDKVDIYDKKTKIYDIKWDTDGEDVDLPETVILPFHLPQCGIADCLSDNYGFCVESFKVDAMYHGKEKL